ncbi:MAG: Flp pilus assembly complex ATPase component TadA [Bdellovibrionaceae bacterium]|nr:Flp pilus assembly complex ATPase component TadA [Pseudobdellovibrionaceae bacterium]
MSAAKKIITTEDGSKKKLLKRRIPIGTICVELGLITQDALEDALDQSKEQGVRLGSYLTKEQILTENELSQALAKQFELEFIDLKGVVPDPKAIKQLPIKIAQQYTILPFDIENDVLKIAVADPLNVLNMSKIRKLILMEYKIYVASSSQITSILQNSSLTISNQSSSENETSSIGNLFKKASAGIEKEHIGQIEALVNRIIEQALSHQASDIHIEPQEDVLQIRERIDGILEKSLELPISHHAAVISRIKILSQLDIAEKRSPQDGHFMHTFGDKTIDLRISTMPTVKGEKIVMRILDKSKMKLDFFELGLNTQQSDQVKHLLHNPYGIILVTGPTGSGKTTSVYSMINYLNSVEKNIITVEDPVEYQIKMINQVQVNPKINLGFSTILKNILRQDPDIIMVGEIRDRETAEIAVRAALTGHLVISTIHTNDALSAVNRLMDIGIDPFLISSSLVGIISQRLVRRLCDHCKKELTSDEKQHPLLEEQELENHKIYKEVGCEKCYNSGYTGREGIYEIFVPNKEARSAINSGQTSQDLEKIVKKTNFKTMRNNGIEKIVSGTTTIDEVIRSTI